MTANTPPPAIVNAIHDAIGVWITENPVTPERILRALEEQKAKVQDPIPNRLPFIQGSAGRFAPARRGAALPLSQRDGGTQGVKRTGP
jgi:hypothetical protein